MPCVSFFSSDASNETLGYFSLAYGIVSILVWAAKLLLLLLRISPNPFRLPHIIASNMLLGTSVFLLLGVALLAPLPPSSCSALLVVGCFLLVQYFTGQALYVGWFFLWTLCLLARVTPRLKALFLSSHFGLSALFLLGEYAALAVYASGRHPRILTVVLLLNYVFLVYCALLLLACLTGLLTKFWRYPPAVITQAKLLWGSHLLFFLLLVANLLALPVSLAFPDLPLPVVAANAALVVAFTSLVQLCIFITINTDPSRSYLSPSPSASASLSAAMPEPLLLSAAPPASQSSTYASNTPLLASPEHYYRPSQLVTNADEW